MKKILFLIAVFLGGLFFSCTQDPPDTGPVDLPDGTIIDHQFTTAAGLTEERIQNAKESLSIVYWHTSHGSQLVVGCGQNWDGSSDMDEFYGGNGWYILDLPDSDRIDGGLYIYEVGTSICQFAGEEDDWDLDVSIDRFEQAVRDYLADSLNAETNVVMASWCGGVSGATEAQITHYLTAMTGLETDFPDIIFVYMTGHADGTGLEGNLHLRNQQIRAYCETNNRWLYDFYDIDCHDPDGYYYGDMMVDDSCNYDANGDEQMERENYADDIWVALAPDRNWALDWQDANADGWWDCPTDYHTMPVNRNQKARAAWQLWCLIAESR
ncbi:MAG: hypothetical protein JW874_09920 [Spirochaetales bacterium]|nr:hypothetical protein [Spirochaetales bacterium]